MAKTYIYAVVESDYDWFTVDSVWPSLEEAEAYVRRRWPKFTKNHPPSVDIERWTLGSDNIDEEI
jgi:hypothetical protein